MACADILDTNGRIVYSKCVEDKRREEVDFNIKFAKADAEEIIIKNSLLKLGDDLANNVKFKEMEFPVIKNEKNLVVMEDKYNVLTEGANLRIFTNIGKVDGIGENVYVPTWEVDILSKENKKLLGNKNLPLAASVAEPSAGDVAFLNGIVMNTNENMKILKMCNQGTDLGGDYKLDALKNLTMCGISSGSRYPLCDTQKFSKDAERYSKPQYGFKGLSDNVQDIVH